jgi:hypothetical protein
MTDLQSETGSRCAPFYVLLKSCRPFIPERCWRMLPPIALRVARYFGTSADIRMGIQTDYDLEIARARGSSS